jgi:hypothetical protein
MTTFTPILHAPQVAPNQNQKEATINTAMAVFEAACNDRQSISLAGGNHQFTIDEFTKYFHTVVTGAAVARTLTILNTVRFFAVSNTGSATVTVQCLGSAGLTVNVLAGKRVLLLSDGTDVLAITSGVARLQDLTDVSGADAATNAQALVFDSGASLWEATDVVVPHSFSDVGVPAAGKRLYRHSFIRTEKFAANFAGSQAHADVAATINTFLDVFKNGTLVGTIHFAPGSNTATFSTGGATVTFAAGDILTIEASNYADATLAGINATLKAVLA